MKTRIALIHATPVSMKPVEQAFAERWPEARLQHLLDDSLSADLLETGALTEEIMDRILSLARYGQNCGVDGILYSCSAFGKAIERVKELLDIPVLKPNEAMFDDALAAGTQAGMLVTFKPSVYSMEKEFAEAARSVNSEASLTTLLVEEAMSALQQGDVRTHNRLLMNGVRSLSGIDVLMLAQFSTSQAYREVSSVSRCPVLTSPISAVERLKREIVGA